MPECLICFGALPDSSRDEAHGKCATRLYGKRRVPRLDVAPEEMHLLGLRMAGRVSLSGVQAKIALREDRARLRLVEDSGGSYILKPPSAEYPDLPQVEQLTMLLARSFGISTATTGLIRLKDHSLALLARRFDRDGQRKVSMEDFCQLAEKLPRDKYEGSYEACAKLLRTHSEGGLADGLELFRVILFSWWVGNDDLHLKNLSLSEQAGVLRLSPAYDLVSTVVVGLPDRLALTLGGKHSNFRPADWLELASGLQVSDRSVEAEFRKFAATFRTALALVLRAPLRTDLKVRFLEHLRGRSSVASSLWEASLDNLSRPTERRLKPAVPTTEDVAASLNRVRDAFVRAGAQARGPQPDDIAWLAQFEDGPIFSESGAYGSDPERTARAFLAFQRYQWISRVVESAENLPGAGDVLKHLKRLCIDDAGRVDGQAGDRLFELEVAAALSVTGHFTVRMDETDVVLVDPEGPELGIECKRPRSLSAVAANASKALEQLRERGRGGFVFLSLSEALGPRVVLADREGSTPRELQRLLDEALADVSQDLELLFSPSEHPETLDVETVLGAVVVLEVLVLRRSAGGDGYLVRYQTIAKPIPNPHLDEYSIILEFLADAMVAGSGVLQR